MAKGGEGEGSKEGGACANGLHRKAFKVGDARQCERRMCSGLEEHAEEEGAQKCRGKSISKGKRKTRNRVSSLGRPPSDSRSTSGTFTSLRDCRLLHSRSNGTRFDHEETRRLRKRILHGAKTNALQYTLV
jgi:hypothetical protein